MTEETTEITPPPSPAIVYWTESRRPLTSLVFIAPLLVVYELGVLTAGAESIRNGADAWLRNLLYAMGLGQYFLLPVLTIGILLGWHHVTQNRWHFSRRILFGMLAESLLLAFFLRTILLLQDQLFYGLATPLPEAEQAGIAMLAISGKMGQLASFLGAGIYEELLFRLILLSGVMYLIEHGSIDARTSKIMAVVISSLLFSLAHYVGPDGETLQVFSFLFRFVAGVFFSYLFLYRGFGIAAGTHAAYDILVGLH